MFMFPLLSRARLFTSSIRSCFRWLLSGSSRSLAYFLYGRFFEALHHLVQRPISRLETTLQLVSVTVSIPIWAIPQTLVPSATEANSAPYAPPNHAFNRTRRYGPCTWRASLAAGRLTWSC